MKNLSFNPEVAEYNLSCGIKLLVIENFSLAPVSIQLWYKIGSRFDPYGKKGLAHMVEHMIYKGTTHLSEIDLSAIIFKLMGSSNAYTSQDYTWYNFTIPENSIHEIFFLLNEIMYKALFEQDKINSEINAVIAELSRDKDNALKKLTTTMLSVIFKQGPYHYPIIGLVDNIVSFTQSDLKIFYDKYYGLENPTIIIAGSCKREKIYKQAEKIFNKQKDCQQKYQSFNNINTVDNHKSYFLNVAFNENSKNIVLYKNIYSTILQIGFVIPGASQINAFIINALRLILTDLDSSRLSKIIIDQHKLAQVIYSNHYERFDSSVLFIIVEGISRDNINRVTELVYSIINDIVAGGFTAKEMQEVRDLMSYNYYQLYYDNEQLAQVVGLNYLAQNTKEYLYYYLSYFNGLTNNSAYALERDLKEILAVYCTKNRAFTGCVQPFSSTHSCFTYNQNKSKARSQSINSAKNSRVSCLEKPSFVYSIKESYLGEFNIPLPIIYTLENGLQVSWYNNSRVPCVVEIIIDTQLYSDYDSEHLLGITDILNNMIVEYTLTQEKCESLGVFFSINNGTIHISTLSKNLVKSLSLVAELLQAPQFTYALFSKACTLYSNNSNDFWYNPYDVAEYLVNKAIYQKGPLARKPGGELSTLDNITLNKCKKYYKELVTPLTVSLSIVGDIAGYNMKDLIDCFFGKWHSTQKEIIINYPDIDPVRESIINYSFNKDQVILCYGGLSVSQSSKDYYPLYIYDQIFMGGVLANMSSTIFNIRDHSGLFYEANGSLVKNAGSQPGIFYIQLLASSYKLYKIEHLIENSIYNIGIGLTSSNIRQAAQALLINFRNRFQNNTALAYTFLRFQDRLDQNYYYDYKKKLFDISVDDIQQSLKRVFSKNLVKVRVGCLL